MNSHSDIIVGLVGGISAGIGIWVIDRIRDAFLFDRDEKRIIKFFNDHQKDTYDMRNTFRIASEVNLTESRVRHVCSYSDKVVRNQLKDELWDLR